MLVIVLNYCIKHSVCDASLYRHGLEVTEVASFYDQTSIPNAHVVFLRSTKNAVKSTICYPNIC